MKLKDMKLLEQPPKWKFYLTASIISGISVLHGIGVFYLLTYLIPELV